MDNTSLHWTIGHMIVYPSTCIITIMYKAQMEYICQQTETAVYTSVSIACILPHQGSNKSLKLCCESVQYQILMAYTKTMS